MSATEGTCTRCGNPVSISQESCPTCDFIHPPRTGVRAMPPAMEFGDDDWVAVYLPAELLRSLQEMYRRRGLYFFENVPFDDGTRCLAIGISQELWNRVQEA